MSKIVCFGEVLWDVFPTHKKIGGAPLNVALRLNSFVNEVTMISSVGNDDDGRAIINYIKDSGVNIDEIQINENFKTSHVIVRLDDTRSASYTIEFPCAWDHIELKKSSKDVVRNSDAFIFGSLVTRNKISRNTLFELLEIAEFKIFDVNLRPPHYSIPVLKELMNIADFIKFNDSELLEICANYNFRSKDLTENIKFIARETKTNQVCVTLGSKGATLFINGKFYKSNGYYVTVKDTVGAGDSFLATIIHELLNGTKPMDAINIACAVGALVASKEGANPQISNNELKNIMI
ncbi:carbohydrate kinase [Aureibaculum sp. 2210JD6-5]|uniref:carbohydrate kinase family protein n=1 Tax=Aureibaculum sp. 2210JD6-5 TaxID=3103957 RepID=UPI002AACE17D|nr:carbohydrate kinase [Aureibaculum sp. 2210JD6-5]MDY7395894.1 carbohydrate kinase [Aureibaculum sp. 2210JD6-5]